MIPVLVGLAALGGVVIASQSGESENPKESAPASETDDTKSSKRIVDESEVPEAVRKQISAQESTENPDSEKTTKRVVDESDVPDAIREKVNAQEQLQGQDTQKEEHQQEIETRIHTLYFKHDGWIEEVIAQSIPESELPKDIRRKIRKQGGSTSNHTLYYKHDGWVEEVKLRSFPEAAIPENVQKIINESVTASKKAEANIAKSAKQARNFPSYIYSEKLNHWLEEDPTKKEEHNKQIPDLRRIHHEHDGWKLTIYWDNISTGNPDYWGEQVVTRSIPEAELPEDIRKAIKSKEN